MNMDTRLIFSVENAAEFAARTISTTVPFVRSGAPCAPTPALFGFPAAEVCGPVFRLIFASFDRATMSRKSSLLN